MFSQDDEPEVYDPPRDYGTDWRIGVMFGYTPEDGLLLGGGPIVYKFGFRKMPYCYRMQLAGGVAHRTGAVKFEYTALYPSLSSRLTFEILARVSEVEVRNFYGLGNDSERNDGLDENGFYRLRSREYHIQPTISAMVAGKLKFGVGPLYRHFALRARNEVLLGSAGIDRGSFAGGIVSLQYDMRDRAVATTRGTLIQCEGIIMQDTEHRNTTFRIVRADVRTFVSLASVTLALRAGGQFNSGPVPFFHAAFLGGSGSLRGFNSERFAGDASLFVNSELRIHVLRMRMLVPTRVSLLGIADAGRVWLNGNSPGGVHVGVGGGLALAPVTDEATVSISIVKSRDGLFTTAGLGFGF